MVEESKIDLSKVFIWTEAINCGELLNPFINSYLTHHQFKLHVFGKKSDFKLIENVNHESIIKIDVSDLGPKFEKKLEKCYKNGHKGTAFLWANIIRSRSEKFFVHLDADTIFVGESISGIISKLVTEKFALVGSRRPYKFRNYRKTGIDGFLLNRRFDVVNTDCFGFNKNFIKIWPFFWLRRKIQGKRCSVKPVVDFFDPIAFEIIRKKGNVFYMDSQDTHPHGKIIEQSTFYSSRISFAAVGSGINFYKNPLTRSSPGYKAFALGSYSLYAKWILKRDLGIPRASAPDLETKLVRLDTNTWSLQPESK